MQNVNANLMAHMANIVISGYIHCEFEAFRNAAHKRQITATMSTNWHQNQWLQKSQT